MRRSRTSWWGRFARTFCRAAIAALAPALCFASAAQADTYRLSPVQDTDIRANNGGRNACGSCTELVTRDHATGEYRPLYQFDLTEILPGSRLVSATLRLWVTGADNSNVRIYRVAQPWTEATLTWASANGVAHDAAAAASFVPAQSGRYYEMDVTSLVASWLSGAANHGLIMRIAGNNSYASFTSREWAVAAQRPELVLEMLPPPNLTIVAFSQLVSDPVNGAANPKAIPGALVNWSATISSNSAGTPDQDGVAIVMPLPAQAELFVGDLGSAGSGPVAFVQGSPSSGLSYTYASRSSTADDLAFSNNGGAGFGYVPVPDAQGYDRAVTHVRVAPKGVLAGSAGTPPNFTLRFRTRIR